jgi:hypothetical protein
MGTALGLPVSAGFAPQNLDAPVPAQASKKRTMFPPSSTAKGSNPGPTVRKSKKGKEKSPKGSKSMRGRR